MSNTKQYDQALKKTRKNPMHFHVCSFVPSIVCASVCSGVSFSDASFCKSGSFCSSFPAEGAEKWNAFYQPLYEALAQTVHLCNVREAGNAHFSAVLCANLGKMEAILIGPYELKCICDSANVMPKRASPPSSSIVCSDEKCVVFNKAQCPMLHSVQPAQWRNRCMHL